jgi:hypothetical protein
MEFSVVYAGGRGAVITSTAHISGTQRVLTAW